MTVLVTLVLNAAKVSNGRDATEPGDYYADAGDPRVQADLASTGRPHAPRAVSLRRPPPVSCMTVRGP